MKLYLFLTEKINLNENKFLTHIFIIGGICSHPLLGTPRTISHRCHPGAFMSATMQTPRTIVVLLLALYRKLKRLRGCFKTDNLDFFFIPVVKRSLGTEVFMIIEILSKKVVEVETKERV